MKIKTHFLLLLFAIILMSNPGCIFPPEDDNPDDPILQKIRKIEAYLTIGDAQYKFQFKDGSNDITANGGLYIWFNTIEGTNSHTATVFRSDFDSKILGKTITGFLEAQWSLSNNKEYIKIDARRISKSSNSTETYEMHTDFIPKVRQDTDDVTDLIEVDYEAKGFSACNSLVNNVSYVFDSPYQTKTMTSYNCTDDSKITVKMFLKK